jgi:hypothetical protein
LLITAGKDVDADLRRHDDFRCHPRVIVKGAWY